MKRKLRTTKRSVKTWEIDALPKIEHWVAGNTFAPNLILLAHADDGVVWGKLDEGKLLTSDKQYPKAGLPPLRNETLQTCRLFNETGELLLWRTANGWSARQALDESPEDGEDVEFFDEDQILWGTQVEPELHLTQLSDTDASASSELNLFTLVSDGVQGLLHAVPLPASDIPFDPVEAPEKRRPLRLTVRHYLAQDSSDGTMFIAGSRLVKLYASADVEAIAGEVSNDKA